MEAIAGTGPPVEPMLGLDIGAGPFETKEEAKQALATMRDCPPAIQRDRLQGLSERQVGVWEATEQKMHLSPISVVLPSGHKRQVVKRSDLEYLALKQVYACSHPAAPINLPCLLTASHQITRNNCACCAIKMA